MSSAKKKHIAKIAPQQELLDDLHEIQGTVQDIFCTLESATAALEKAENEGSIDRFIRASRVVERCRDMIEELREDIDALSMVARKVVPHAQ